MKYVVLLCDGMADYKLEELGGKTPMEAADKPNMDFLAQNGYTGLVKTVGDGFKPGSDVANLSVMGYDPKLYYSGRSPLEAASIGIKMKDTDVAFRCNLVTLSEEESSYEDKRILDYCAGDISTEEAKIIVEDLAKEFNNEEFSLYPGVSYRHCLIWSNGPASPGTLTPPHDITGKLIKDYLPKEESTKKLLDMMKKSYEILMEHPVNKARRLKGLAPANSAWFWGEGQAKPLMSFKEKTGLSGAVISAVDLIKGIGKLSGMKSIDVEGATGYIDTNFDGKAKAAIEELAKGTDFVYIHIEAPDECGHRHEIENKVKSISLIDHLVLEPVLKALETYDDYKIMILPDHATPISLRTHTSDPVPFLIYRKGDKGRAPSNVFCEQEASKTGVYVDIGHTLMDLFIKY